MWITFLSRNTSSYVRFVDDFIVLGDSKADVRKAGRRTSAHTLLVQRLQRINTLTVFQCQLQA